MLKAGRINFSFAAAHHLPGHDGLCKNLHGHNYKLEVEFSGQIIHGTGMIIDFQEIKQLVNENVVKHLDHKHLNELHFAIHDCVFPNENPTAENMVRWMVSVLDRANSTGVELSRIKLWETDNCYVVWEKD